MAKPKSQERRLAELISRRENIKVASAMRRIQRAVKADKPLPGATRRQAEIFREIKPIIIQRSRKARRASVPFASEVRSRLSFSGTRIMRLFGRVESGSSGSGDIRDRWVTWPVTAAQANKILNAESEREAAEQFAEIVPYVADIVQIQKFQFDGESVRF